MVLSRRLTAWNRAGFFALLFGLITSEALFFERLSFAANEDKPVADVRIVVDISGSMRKNDPHNLRIPAAELLIDLLPDNSKAGLWTFGKYVNMLVKHDYVSAGWKRNAKIKAKKINSIAMYTNIGEAVEVASVGWLEPDPRYERSIILLTDGKVDISKSPTQNENEQNRILEQIIPRLTSSKVKVHTIALSANSDQLLMKRLAMNTGGSFSVANSANDLMKIFLKAFDAAVPSEQVPLEGNKFSIDASVKEFTALIFRASKAKPTQLTSPDGVSFNRNTKNPNLSWLSTNAYDLITFKNPTFGEWRLKADIDPSNRVSIISDLSLDVDKIPANVAVGEKIVINIHLLEKGGEITDLNFLTLVDIHVSQAQEDGKTWSATLGGSKKKGVIGPGVYTAKFGKTIVPGNHEFTIIADGKTFQRKISQKVSVYEDLVHIEKNEIGEGEERQFALKIVPQPGALNLEQTSIVVNVQLPDLSTEDFVAELVSNEYWEYLFSPSAGSGAYRFTVILVGKASSGRDLSLHRGPYLFEYTIDELETMDGLLATEPMADVTEEIQKEAEPSTQEEVVDPEAVEPPAIEEIPPSKEDVPEESEESGNDSFDLISLIAMLVGGNVVLGGIGYGIYKLITRPKKDKGAEDINEATESEESKPSEMIDLEEEEDAPLEAGTDDLDATVLASASPAIEESKAGANEMSGMDDMGDLSIDDDTPEPDINDSLLSLDDDGDDDDDINDEDLSNAVADELMDLDSELGDMDLSEEDSDDDDSMDDVDDLLDLDGDMEDEM